MEKLSFEEIEQFLEGSDPQQYIVGIESSYSENLVYLIINDPETGKRIEPHKFKPFLWVKNEVVKRLFNGDKRRLQEVAKKNNIRFKKLRTLDDNGDEPERMSNGYKYLVTINGQGYSALQDFFRHGGVDPRHEDNRKLFTAFSPDEQFLIQTGKRLFKGTDDYNDVHRLQFDLETEGLDPVINGIFQIGIKDNKGYERILETKGDNGKERRESERANIKEFFEILYELKPDIITAYNSENFDWPFIEKRCERLGIDFYNIVKTLNPNVNVKRKDAMLKLGGEQEAYKQTYIWGINVLDISHSVRRAQAINSSIKKWSLKYITQFSGVAKPNRVYVNGDVINKTWSDARDHWFNDTNGTWGLLGDNELEADCKIVKGDYIVQRYLLDDLWETEQVDGIYNQAAYLIAKLLPTSYMRSSTMGTAGQWKLIMAAWSYENNLAIPELQNKREFTGGLSRLLEVGFAKNVVKADFAALYPKIELTHAVFPSLDISGVMEGLLTYVVDKRDEFKFLTSEHKDKSKDLATKLEERRNTLTQEEIEKIEKAIKKHKKLASNYDKKQLPLKILANSFFGAYGAPYIFNWGDSDCAEETTCRGRQYLRLMVRFFTEKYGFRALVGDSVTYDTPVYIKYPNGLLDIKPICDLFNEDSKFIDLDRFRDYENKPFEILTVSGWKKINYVYRHGTEKQIHRITTKDRLVNVTEDHSLFQNGIQIKPSSLNRGDNIDVYDKLDSFNILSDVTEEQAWLYGFFLGDGSANCSSRITKYVSRKSGETHLNKSKRADWKISNSKLEWLEKLKLILEKEFNLNSVIKDHRKSSGVYNLVVHKSEFVNEFCNDFYTSYREKKVPSFILNSNNTIKMAFLNGVCASDGYGDNLDNCSSIGMKSQIAMAGLSILMNELKIEYKIITRNDKQNFITFNLKNANRNNSSFTEKTLKKSNEVWKNEIILNKDKNNYVYDISTEDGTFIGGVGLINLKNTDGMNFAIPENIDEVKYITNASHWKTNHYEVGQELIGLDAVLAEFNESYMLGRMGLDIDDICDATINFARKNYANDIDGKVKLVGNSIKSKAMPEYIEEFIDKGVRMLLDDKGYEFIEYYYEHVNKIYGYQIPALKMASKSRVKMTPKNYVDVYCKGVNKAGAAKSRQAYMELIILNNLDVNLGDTIYYINTGDAKSHSDIKAIKNKDNGTTTVEFNCKLIPQEQIDLDPNLINTEYNVPKYLDAFNKRIKPLLVCFDPEIRSKVIVNVIKDRKTKLLKLEERSVFTEKQCKLIAGKPFEESDQDSYEALMTMEDKEIRFWDSVNKIPNNIEEDEWEKVRLDYHERLAKTKADGIIKEKETFDYICKNLKPIDFQVMTETGELVKELNELFYVDEETNMLVSNKWGEVISSVTKLFDYLGIVKEREVFMDAIEGEYSYADKFNMWLDKFNSNEINTDEDDNYEIHTNELIIEPIVNVVEDDDEWGF